MAGPHDELVAALDADGAVYVAAARAWLVAPQRDRLDDLVAVHAPELHDGLAHGLLAIHEKCPHLGCRVPYCESSGWFECHCHGTMFTDTGEHRSGPAPRGMDLFAVAVADGIVEIDTGKLVRGLPLGTNVAGRPPRGPHCVDGDPA